MERDAARPWPEGRWRRLLADAVADVGELLDLVGVDPGAAGIATAGEAGRFAVRVPRGFVARMRRGDPRDPLLLQVLPHAAENRAVEGFSTDPVGELRVASGAGVLSKYRGRALVVATGACAVHCRYCFRRHFPYGEASGIADRGRTAVAAVAEDSTVSEVILSGGDPLTLPDPVVGDLVGRLAAVPHVERIRIHTRVPVVLPERVDEALTRWLGALGRRAVVVLHANHPAELDDDVARAAAALGAQGATLLNQSVLLAGVNDDADVLCGLSERLFAIGVLPYYLHLLDPVAGAAHFDVPEERAARLAGEVAARLPGYLVPRLVREISGRPAKVPVMPAV